MGIAEKDFREAFERLKQGKPVNLPMTTCVSQNNVAKEAGRDPSALKKSRYPSLIAEIQHWIKENAQNRPQSPRQTILAQRSRNRTLREKIDAIKSERDHALSLLVEADARILDLTIENARLRMLQQASNITPLSIKKIKKDV